MSHSPRLCFKFRHLMVTNKKAHLWFKNKRKKNHSMAQESQAVSEVASAILIVFWLIVQSSPVLLWLLGLEGRFRSEVLRMLALLNALILLWVGWNCLALDLAGAVLTQYLLMGLTAICNYLHSFSIKLLSGLSFFLCLYIKRLTTKQVI